MADRVTAARGRSSGYTIAEMLVVLLCSTVLVGALATLLVVQARGLETGIGRATAREAARTAALVLPAEARWLDPASELAHYVPDSVRIRAYRALAIPCFVAASGDVVARVRGLRDIDPTKDSALWLDDAGGERALAVLSAMPAAAPVSGCVPASEEEVVRLHVAPDTPAAGLLIFFERGSYHLVNGALRYRRGTGGRQPLTIEWIDPQSGFRLLPAGAAGAPGPIAAEIIIGRPGGAPFRRTLLRLDTWNGRRR